MSVLLGGVVLLGRYTNHCFLAQVWPPLVPLHYRLAWGLLLCGVSLLALAWGWTRLEMVSSIAVVVVEVLTLYEYFFEVNPGLEQAIFAPFTTLHATYRGRMAPQTALSFLLAGTALAVMRLPGRHGLTSLISGLLGSLVLGFGLVTCLSHLVVVLPAHSWQPSVQMAIHAAVGCIIVGSGLSAAAWDLYDEVSTGISAWVSLGVGPGVTAVTPGLWQGLLLREHRLIKRTVAPGAASIQEALIEQVGSRLRLLERMAQ